MPQDVSTTLISENIDLPRLVDLCAERLDLNIQYDASVLQGKLTLRQGRGVTDAELWTLTNRLLASRGFTSVRLPGENTINIVKLSEAAGLARVEERGLEDTQAGFVKLMIPLGYRTAQEVIEPIKLVLSKTGGTATPIGGTNRLLLADLKPHLAQALDLLALVDVARAETTIERIPAQFIPPDELAGQVEKLAVSRAEVDGRKLSGKLLAAGDGQGLLLVAPVEEAETWRELVTRLDRGEVTETRSYSTQRFGLAEVGKLLEDVVRGDAERAKKQWRMVTDELTGQLHITATTEQHSQILQFLARLETVPAVASVIESIAVRYIDPESLIAMVESLESVRATVTGQPLKGKLIPSPDQKGVLLVAPGEEVEDWRDLVERMDQRLALETATYTPKYFPVEEVGDLVDEVAAVSGSTTPETGWKMIRNSLTGSLVITGTPAQHRDIQELMARLDDAAPTSRRPLRSFVIRNRSAEDLVALLRDLVSGGVLAAQESQGSGEEEGFVPAAPELPLQVPPQGSSSEEAAASMPGQGNSLAVSLDGQEFLISADPDTNTIIAVGDARFLQQLEELIGRLDVRQPQVMVEVLIVALSESDAFDLGIEIQRLGVNDDTIVSLAQLFGLGSPDLNDLTSTATSGTGFTGVVLDPGDFSVLLQALQALNDGNSLTVPRVLVNNNETAILDATVQTPYSSTNASNTVATTSFGGTLDAGTAVTITPMIAEGDHLVLQYSISVSQFVGESSDPSLPPPRQENKLESVATIPDGYRVALGGLDVDTLAEAVSRIPWLADIPWLGRLFESRSRTLSKTRFFVFLGASIMRHEEFEDLKYLSDLQLAEAEVDSGWPEVTPRVIR